MHATIKINQKQNIQFEYTYFILGLESQSQAITVEVINFDISFCNELDGDVISDCIINVLDYIQLVHHQRLTWEKYT